MPCMGGCYLSSQVGALSLCPILPAAGAGNQTDQISSCTATTMALINSFGSEKKRPIVLWYTFWDAYYQQSITSPKLKFNM